MKLDPGFINHWKTERLISELGADGVVAILRLWGNAQIRREFSGLNFTPRRLAMETKWKGDENHLFSTLTDPEAPWLDPEDGGTWAIHGFSEHQHQVVKLWEHGKMGGRPRKASPAPSSKDKDSSPSSCSSPSSSSSSSSYPICEPSGNHMVPKSGEASAAKPELSEIMPTGAAADMLALQSRIQSIKPAWKLALTYEEQQSMMRNGACLASLEDADWQRIQRYLHARLPEGMPGWQPRSRGKFIETLPDVHDHACRWEEKNGDKPKAKGWT